MKKYAKPEVQIYQQMKMKKIEESINAALIKKVENILSNVDIKDEQIEELLKSMFLYGKEKAINTFIKENPKLKQYRKEFEEVAKLLKLKESKEEDDEDENHTFEMKFMEGNICEISFSNGKNMRLMMNEECNDMMEKKYTGKLIK